MSDGFLFVELFALNPYIVLRFSNIESDKVEKRLVGFELVIFHPTTRLREFNAKSALNMSTLVKWKLAQTLGCTFCFY